MWQKFFFTFENEHFEPNLLQHESIPPHSAPSGVNSILVYVALGVFWHLTLDITLDWQVG